MANIRSRADEKKTTWIKYLLEPTTPVAAMTQWSCVVRVRVCLCAHMCVCASFLSIPRISGSSTVVACDGASACHSRMWLFREVSLVGTKGVWSSLLSWSSDYLTATSAWLWGETHAKQLETQADLKIHECQFIVGDHDFPQGKNLADRNKLHFQMHAPSDRVPWGWKVGKEYEGEVCVIQTRGLLCFCISSAVCVNPNVVGGGMKCFYRRIMRWVEGGGKHTANVFFWYQQVLLFFFF